MRGTVLYGPRDIRFEDREDPKIIEPTDAVLQLAATCVCGSDLWPYRGVQPIDGPTPMGHEYCGIVEEVGSAVKSIKPGQFVVGSFATSDSTCSHCQYGYQSSCVHREFMLRAQAPFLRVPQADGTLVPTPGGVPSKDLVPSLLAASDVLGTGWFAADAANVKAGGTVVVVGPKALDHGDVAHSGKVVGIRSLVLNRLRCAGRYEKERRLPARYKGEQKSQRQSEGRQPNNNAAFSEPPGTTVNLGSIRCQTVSNRDHYRHQGKINNISSLIQEKNCPLIRTSTRSLRF